MRNNDFLNGNPPQARVSIDDSAGPPAPRTSARAKLQTVGDVSHELAKLYREARSGKIDVADASRLANMLSILSRILSDSELEARLEALEQRSY